VTVDVSKFRHFSSKGLLKFKLLLMNFLINAFFFFFICLFNIYFNYALSNGATWL